MKPPTIISASAGTGKTHRLATQLTDSVEKDGINPDGVVATTFTNKAAAELKERVRTHLLKAGKKEAAERLAFARIGTVNSICARLLSEYAFEMGVSPELSVLDEAQSAIAFDRALSMALAQGEDIELEKIGSRMKGLDWEKDVRTIVDLARSNGIGPSELQKSATRSMKSILTLFGAGDPLDLGIDKELRKALECLICQARAKAETRKKELKGAGEDVGRLQKIVAILRAEESLAWSEWLWLRKLKIAADLKEEVKPVVAIAERHEQHPQLREDCRRVIELVFEIAAKAIGAYEEYKRDHGLIDFVDQEVQALTLLRREDVRKKLQDEIDLILVDEFQDTSPLQLAIFLSLTDLARFGSYWVGDQKQAIFGFRQTDPALMDAVIDGLLEGRKPETLSESHRSRRELVLLTSELFWRAFAQDQLPKERVAIEPHEKEDDPALGPIMEQWSLEAKKNADDTAAIATGVRQLLQQKDPVLVRDKQQKKPRPVRPCDIAVLCRTNEQCKAVAAALKRLAIDAVVASAGLMTTPEALLVLAGLRYWIDPKDTLAAAELLRLTDYAGEPDRFLENIISTEASTLYANAPILKRVRECRDRECHSGGMAALDEVMEAVEAREWCLRWGNSAARLANLDALREHACKLLSNERFGAKTPMALLAGLEELATVGQDRRAARLDENAVVVSTWHATKGLEWPIVVLYGQRQQNNIHGLGPQIFSDVAGVKLDDPLAGRWIRYWVSPYGGNTSDSPFHTRLAQDHPTRELAEKNVREQRRLLYVGWTRARDRVALVSREDKLNENIFGLLSENGTPLLKEILEGDGIRETTWAGMKIRVQVRRLSPTESVSQEAKPGEAALPAGPKDHPRAWLTPSKDAKPVRATIGEPVEIGRRLKIPSGMDMNVFGNAVHGFLAADREGLTEDQRTTLARGLIESWRIGDELSSEQLLTISARFRNWVTAKWPFATWHREIPIMHRLDSGSIMRGNCDLALETPDGWIVIDHKSFPGTIEDAKKEAENYTAQLFAYADAIKAATGKDVSGCWVHMPVMGIIVQLFNYK